MRPDGDSTRSPASSGPLSMRAERADEAVLAGGSAIDRYTLLGFVGRGGMGTVYAAYDPTLDRKVAIKLIRTSHAGVGSEHRLLREARALAKLSHPNVVAIHEVGRYEGRVFLAMEFVEGLVFDEWVRQLDVPASERERTIVAALRQAGEGLAAAHAAGLVHRDFKPSNVIVGRDGRVRVLDFGLARVHGVDGPSSAAPASTPEGDLPSRITETNAVVGTPRYMAPEQRFGGADLDARCDQFSFCVVAFEALLGRSPFDPQPDPDRGSSSPAVRAVLERGLSIAPDDRFPGMPALLAALDPPRTARRRGMVMGLGGIAVGGIVAGGLALAGSRDDGPTCEPPSERLDASWNPTRRAALRDRFVELDPVGGEGMVRGVVERLDAALEAWAGEYVEACRATWERGEQSSERLDERMTCLRQWERELDGVVDILFAMQADRLDRSLDVVAVLESVERCREPTATMPAGETSEIWLELTRAEALVEAQDFDAAAEVLAALTPRIESLADPRLQARLLLLRGLMGDATSPDDLRATFEAAHAAAVRAGDDVLAAAAATKLALLLTTGLLELRAARPWCDVASAHADRSGDVRRQAHALAAQAVLAVASGASDRGEASMIRAVELLERAGDGQLSSTFELKIRKAVWVLEAGRVEAAADMLDATHRELNALGGTRSALLAKLSLARARGERALGHHLEALVLIEAAAAFHIEHWSPSQVALFRLERGWVRAQLGLADEALADFETARTLSEQAFGRTHESTAESWLRIGALHRERGRLAQARAALDESLAIYEAVFGADHAMLAMVHAELGLLHRAEGEPEAALVALRRALELDRKAHAERDVAVRLLQIGETLAEQGELAEAERHFRDALGLLEPSPSDRFGAHVRVALGRVVRGQGRVDEAIELHRSAVDALTGLVDPVAPEATGELALDLFAAGRRQEAIPLGERALLAAGADGTAPWRQDLERAVR